MVINIQALAGDEALDGAAVGVGVADVVVTGAGVDEALRISSSA